MRAAAIVGALIALGAFAGVAEASDGSPGIARTFHDWITVCDNVLDCTAIGLEPDAGGRAYVVLRRAAGPAATPRIALLVAAPEGSGTTAVSVQVAGGPGFGPRVYSSEAADPYRAVQVPEADVAALVSAIRDGSALGLTVGGDAEKVSLRGAAAALLALDDAQGRVGTVTALARPGTAPADTVPAAPSLPQVSGKPLHVLDPPPARPKGVEISGEAICTEIDDVAVDLGEGTMLRGVCDIAGAYNTSFRFWIVDDRGARLADFRSPGLATDDPAVLSNPGVSENGRTLDAFDLGRGLGDCGDSQSWAWTGSAFVLTAHARMDTCAGVLPDNWPVLYRTEP